MALIDNDLERFLKACRGYRGNAPSASLVNATRSFLLHARSNTSILAPAAAALAGLAPHAAAWVAVTFGTLVEGGVPVETTGPAVMDRFLSCVSQLPTPTQDSEDWPEMTEEQRVIVEAFPMFCQSVVCHLARMPSRREELGTSAPLLGRLEQLEHYGPGASWVREALTKSSGSVIVIHTQLSKGFRLRYSNLSNCFHLFSLLQCTLGQRLPGGQAPDPRVAAVARGRSNDAVTDRAWWHYGNPHCPAAEIGGSLWGEASVRSIPFIDGAQVILLWPPIVAGRSWGAGFLGPHLDALPADLVVEQELTAAECRSWLKRLDIAPDAEWC